MRQTISEKAALKAAFKTKAKIEEYLEEAIKISLSDDPDGKAIFFVALRDLVIGTMGFTKLSEQTGLNRASLYDSLCFDGNPQFETILLVMKAIKDYANKLSEKNQDKYVFKCFYNTKHEEFAYEDIELNNGCDNSEALAA